MVADARISAVLISGDLAASQDFYEQKVGLRLSGDTIKNHLVFDCGEGTTPSPGIGRSAWFKDPDGNTIALFEPE
jgi:predicted enzyme related to lactoylglutathione lyase